MRKPLSKKLRFDVLKRDGFCCQYCGQGAPDVVLHVDHVIPVASGGENDIDNLVAACESCNQGKRASFHNPDLAQIVELKERVSQLEAAILLLRSRESLARERAIATSERLISIHRLEVQDEDFEILSDLVWRVGSYSAQGAFTVAEYEVGSEPCALWSRAIEIMAAEASEWELGA